MNMFSRTLSTRHNNNSNSRRNKEILINENLDQSLNNYKLSPPPSTNRYKHSGSFTFSSVYVIKTVEEVIFLLEGLHFIYSLKSL